MVLGQISETSVMPTEVRRTGNILTEALEGSRGNRHLDRDSGPQTYKKKNKSPFFKFTHIVAFVVLAKETDSWVVWLLHRVLCHVSLNQVCSKSGLLPTDASGLIRMGSQSLGQALSMPRPLLSPPWHQCSVVFYTRKVRY